MSIYDDFFLSCSFSPWDTLGTTNFKHNVTEIYSEQSSLQTALLTNSPSGQKNPAVTGRRAGTGASVLPEYSQGSGASMCCSTSIKSGIVTTEKQGAHKRQRQFSDWCQKNSTDPGVLESVAAL